MQAMAVGSPDGRYNAAGTDEPRRRLAGGDEKFRPWPRPRRDPGSGVDQSFDDKLLGHAAQPKQHSCHMPISHKAVSILVVRKVH
jgi:hypothetical protein